LLKMHVPNQLNQLCRKFNARRSQERVETVRVEKERSEPTVPVDVVVVHQCSHCFTVYDEQYGDSRCGIPAGTPFSQLPPDYVCSTCDAPKQDMHAVEVVPASQH